MDFMENTQLAERYNEQLFLQYARIGKCLSSERRLEILSHLSNSSKSVETIAADTGMSVANVSRHLQILIDANIVTFKKKGKNVFKSLVNELITRNKISLWQI